MDWYKIKEEIYYCDGSLRDIYVLNTNLEDNKKWIDYVNANYSINFYNGKKQIKETQIDFNAVEGYLMGELETGSSATVSLDKIHINNHFFTENTIENDIDPKEINSLHDHEKLLLYMIDISNILDKPVILTPENTDEITLIKVAKNYFEIFLD